MKQDKKGKEKKKEGKRRRREMNWNDPAPDADADADADPAPVVMHEFPRLYKWDKYKWIERILYLIKPRVKRQFSENSRYVTTPYEWVFVYVLLCPSGSRSDPILSPRRFETIHVRDDGDDDKVVRTKFT